MKDKYCAYYTEDKTITSLMVQSLKLCKEDVVLEPAAGQGAFAEEILKLIKPKHLELLELSSAVAKELKQRYADNPIVTVRATDTLLDAKLKKEIGQYTKIIANPPYGAWQTPEKRRQLKGIFEGGYVKETYSLFLSLGVDLLEEHGRLCFIIPDTFLYLNRHKGLREKLLTQTKIDNIIIFPSKLFPNVTFGYANLCIIMLEKDTGDKKNHSVNMFTGFNSLDDLEQWKKGVQAEGVRLVKVKQSAVLADKDKRFYPFASEEISSLISNSKTCFKDVANIVTGLYTGDNRTYVRAGKDNTKAPESYSTVNPKLITQCTDLEGDDKENAYVPFVKGTSGCAFGDNSPQWFVRWDKKAVTFYKTNSKSRFQNSNWYFKEGIALPMVKTSKIKAWKMSGSVFDQSIVGIFPKDKALLKYLLALLNSDLINEVVHQLNPTANNSANYIGQIPFVMPDKKTLKAIDAKVDLISSQIQEGLDAAEARAQLEKETRKLYLSENSK